MPENLEFKWSKTSLQIKIFLKTKVVSTATFKQQSCQLLRKWVSDALAWEDSSRISLGVLTQSRLTNFFIISFWFFWVCFSQWFGTVHTHHSPTLKLASGHICFFYYSTGMGWFTPEPSRARRSGKTTFPPPAAAGEMFHPWAGTNIYQMGFPVIWS